MAKRIWKPSQVLLIGVAISSASLFGCASRTSPPPERSMSEIKIDADRVFEKLKEEEREYRNEGGTTR